MMMESSHKNLFPGKKKKNTCKHIVLLSDILTTDNYFLKIGNLSRLMQFTVSVGRFKRKMFC